jgi:hypothetical protein
MTMRATLRRRFQFTLRSLMILTAAVAILITPVAWVVRVRQRMIQAREDALRAMVLEQYYRSHRPAELPAAPAELASKEARGGPAPPTPPPAAPAQAAALIERLRRENAELKATIERLRRQVERLQAAQRP